MTTYPINLKDDLKGWVKNSKKLMPPRLGTHIERGFGGGREWFKFGYQSDPKVGAGNPRSTYSQDPVSEGAGQSDVFFGHGCYRLKTPDPDHNFGEVDRGGNSPNADSDIEKLQDSCVLPGIIDSDKRISHKNCQGFLMIESSGRAAGHRLRDGQVCFQSGCEDNACNNNSKGLVNDWSKDDARHRWKRLAGSVGDTPAYNTNNYRAVMHEYIDVEKIVTVADVGVGEIFWNNYDIYEPKKMQAEGPSSGSTWWSGCTINLKPMGHESGTAPTLSTVEPASAFTGVVPYVKDWLFGVTQEAHITAADMTWADSTIGRATGWGMRAAGSAGQSPVAPHINDNFPWPFFEYTSDNARKFTMQPYSGDSQKNMGVFTNPSQISASRKGFRGGYPGPEEVALGYPNLSISQAMRKCNEMDGCAGFIMYENDWEAELAGTPQQDNNLNGNLFPSNANGQHDARGWELVDLERNGVTAADADLNTISGNHNKYYSNFVIFVDDFGAGVGNEAPPPDMRPTDSGDVQRLPSRVFVKKPRPPSTRVDVEPVLDPTGELTNVEPRVYGNCEPRAGVTGVTCTGDTSAVCATQPDCEYAPITLGAGHPCLAEQTTVRTTEQTIINHHCENPATAAPSCGCLNDSRSYQQKVLDNCMIRKQYNDARDRKKTDYTNIKKSYDFIGGGDNQWSTGAAGGALWLTSDAQRSNAQNNNANIPSEHPGWLAQFSTQLGNNLEPNAAVPPKPDDQMTELHDGGSPQPPTCCINSIQAQGASLENVHQCMICPGDQDESPCTHDDYQSQTGDGSGSSSSSGSGSSSSSGSGPTAAERAVAERERVERERVAAAAAGGGGGGLLDGLFGPSQRDEPSQRDGPDQTGRDSPPSLGSLGARLDTLGTPSGGQQIPWAFIIPIFVIIALIIIIAAVKS